MTLPRTLAACLCSAALINLCLTPLWLHLQYGNAFVLTSVRLIKNIIKLPLDTALLYALLKMVEQRRKNLL